MFLKVSRHSQAQTNIVRVEKYCILKYWERAIKNPNLATLNHFKVFLLFSCSVVSDSLGPHRLQHIRLPCPSLSPRVSPNSWPLSQWGHPTIWYWRREWQTTSAFLPWEPQGQYERAKRYDTERLLPQVNRGPTYHWRRAACVQNKKGWTVRTPTTGRSCKGHWRPQSVTELRQWARRLDSSGQETLPEVTHERKARCGAAFTHAAFFCSK